MKRWKNRNIRWNKLDDDLHPNPQVPLTNWVRWGGLCACGSPGTAGGIVLQHPVDIRDIDSSGHHVGAHQDAARMQMGQWLSDIGNKVGEAQFLQDSLVLTSSELGNLQRSCCVCVSSCHESGGRWPSWWGSPELVRSTPRMHMYWRWGGGGRWGSQFARPSFFSSYKVQTLTFYLIHSLLVNN